MSAPTRQAEIVTTTKNPKNLTGRKADIRSTIKPIITLNALNTIPLPTLVKVVLVASTGDLPDSLSSL